MTLSHSDWLDTLFQNFQPYGTSLGVYQKNCWKFIIQSSHKMLQNIKPATSVHLNYTLPCHNYDDVISIVLRNTINVKESQDSTYFCVLQFWPAGYCGIQQLEGEDKKLAIFSIWNGKDEETKWVKKDSDATIQRFGGEGEGLKCMKPFQWKVGETIEFIINAQRVGSKFEISCSMKTETQESFFCTYEYRGLFPIQSMSSFIEDFKRWNGAHGLHYKRGAVFSNASCTIDGVEIDVGQVRFTKTEGGHDVHGCDRCGWSKVDGSLYMFTGGEKCG